MLQRVRRMLERFRGADRPTPEMPARTLAEDLREAGMLAEHWARDERSRRRLYVDLEDVTVAELGRRFPAHRSATVTAADGFVRHEFDLLGSGPFVPVDPDRPVCGPYRPIDWRLDPVRAARFPTAFPHKAWNFETMRPAGSDIKFPWELARCQHLPTLGQAYRLTGGEEYAREIVDEIRDFTEANPPGLGVNWTCTMDVALRAANWAFALALVRRCPEIDDATWLEMSDSLFAHGVFIEHNLENTYEVTSNHFVSDIVGLYVLSSVFAAMPSGQRWRISCRQWLEEEMRKQVLDDGADYESSIPYHRLMIELFMASARLAAWTGEQLSESFERRLCRMVTFFAAVTRPDGLMPAVGDADDGRVHVLSRCGAPNPQDGRHVFAPAALMCDHAEWLSLAGESNLWEAAWWGFELPADSSRPAIQSPPRVEHFPQAGITVLRAPRVFLLITNGIVGTAGFGNHKHNDNLAFEYHLDGAPILVDPGSYVYTSDPASRNRFRSTGSHNTLTIDGAEQNELRPGYLFRMFEQANPEHLAVEESEELLVYKGRHRAYQRLAEPVTHTRSFDLDRVTSRLNILDVLEGRGRHVIRWHFHCAPGVTVNRTRAGSLEIIAGLSRLVMTLPVALELEIRDDWYSPSYGVRLPCLAFNLQATIEIRDRCEYSFELRADDTSDVRY
jgi:hypothetical protein